MIHKTKKRDMFLQATDSALRLYRTLLYYFQFRKSILAFVFKTELESAISQFILTGILHENHFRKSKVTISFSSQIIIFENNFDVIIQNRFNRFVNNRVNSQSLEIDKPI